MKKEPTISCERNFAGFGNTAGVAAGINLLEGKFTSAAGRMMDSLTRGVGRSATTALRVTESFDGPSLNTLAAVPLVLEAGALLAARRTWRRSPKLPPAPPAVRELLKDEPQELPAWAARFAAGQNQAERNPGESERFSSRVRQRAALAVGLLKVGQAASAFAGTGLARLSRQNEPGVTAGLEQQFFFPSSTQRPVRLWPSRLTSLFNRADAGLSDIQRSDGLMVEWQGQSWHRGAVVIKTAQGERTMTHLQSLTVPATHYYFDRRLSDNETVGIITGQKGFEPRSLAGYAGQVSEVEALMPAWSQTKRGLIQAHLRWGEVGRGAEEQRGKGAGALGSEGAGGQRGKGEAEQRNKGAEGLGSEAIHPLDGVKAEITLGGTSYPAMVRRIVPGPAGHSLAEATYYDEASGVWQAVEDESARARLAEQVQAGQIEPWERTEASQ